MRKQTHKTVMFDVLQALYDSKYASILGFKGGTALYFFYGLPRFSVDLDFDLLNVLSKEETNELKQGIFNILDSKLGRKGVKIKTEGTLNYSFKFILQYGGEKKLKIEFNSKIYDNNYIIQSLLGTNIQVMNISYMFAHKLCAFLSRYKQKHSIANRDLFDIKFLLENNFQICEKIIEIRSQKIVGTQMDTKQYISYLLNFIQENKKEIPKNILYGIGELIDTNQKIYMKNEFLNDLIKDLKLYLL